MVAMETRVTKLLRLVGTLLLGERAMLRPGGPDRLARLFGLRAPRYVPHPYMLYALNRSWASADGRTRHNALGFRGAELASEKASGSLRVVCMGESSTYCTGIADDRDAYPARLHEALAAALPGRTIEVVNAGVGGYTSAENVLRCLFDVVPLEPDLVVYYYTHNDAHARRYPKLSRDYREFSRSWFEPHGAGGVLAALRRRAILALGDIGELVRRTEAHGGRRPSLNVAKNPPEAFAANMAALAAIARDAGARLLFVNPNYRDLDLNDAADLAQPPSTNLAFRAVWEHRRIVENLAQRLGEGLVDLRGQIPYPETRDGFPTQDYLDPVHFTPAGAERAAKIVAQAILAQNLLGISAPEGGT